MMPCSVTGCRATPARWTSATRSPARPSGQALNAAHRVTGAETGFWDDDGRPAPWPDDIDDWTPSTTEPQPVNPGEQPF